MEAITAAHGGGYLLGAGNRLTKFDPDGSTEAERDYEVELVEAIATTDDGYVLAAQDGTERDVLQRDSYRRCRESWLDWPRRHRRPSLVD